MYGRMSFYCCNELFFVAMTCFCGLVCSAGRLTIPHKHTQTDRQTDTHTHSDTHTGQCLSLNLIIYVISCAVVDHHSHDLAIV